MSDKRKYDYEPLSGDGSELNVSKIKASSIISELAVNDDSMEL